MDPDRKRARQEEVVRNIHESVDELQSLLPGKPRSSAPAKDPYEQAFWSMAGRLEEVTQAQARLLSELIELVLPDVKRRASGICSTREPADPARLRALEALFGGAPARARALPWINTPALALMRAGNLSGEGMGPSAPGSGVCLEREFFLLVDGRLVLVESLGVWGAANQGLLRDSLLIGGRVLSAEDFIRESSAFDFGFLLTTLRGLLHDPARDILEGPPTPERSARQERFAALMADLDGALADHAVRLRRVGDSPD